MTVIKRAVEERGFRKLAGVLATKMLERKRLLEFVQEEDYNGNTYQCVRITDEGWLWLELNKSALNLDLRNPPASAPKSVVSDEVPF